MNQGKSPIPEVYHERTVRRDASLCFTSFGVLAKKTLKKYHPKSWWPSETISYVPET
jgi:hypothetical protein